MSKQQPKKKPSPKSKNTKTKTRTRPPVEKPAAVRAKKVTAVPAVAVAPPVSTRSRDPRLPVPGTVLQKRDRHGTVRCECTVDADGITYAGKVYRSLSSAAVAAAKDLALGGKTQNGFAFWGLIKPSRRPSDPLVSLERAWERYRSTADALVHGVADGNRAAVVAAIAKHANVFETIRKNVE